MITEVTIGVMLVMKLFPETPAARLLHLQLVEKPAAWTRRQLIYAALLVGLCFAGGEFVMLAGGADMAMLMAWDMAFAFDVMIAAWTAATMGRLRVMRDYVAVRWRGVRPRSRAVRTRVRKPSADNDDEPGLVALAA